MPFGILFWLVFFSLFTFGINPIFGLWYLKDWIFLTSLTTFSDLICNKTFFSSIHKGRTHYKGLSISKKTWITSKIVKIQVSCLKSKPILAILFDLFYITNIQSKNKWVDFHTLLNIYIYIDSVKSKSTSLLRIGILLKRLKTFLLKFSSTKMEHSYNKSNIHVVKSYISLYLLSIFLKSWTNQEVKLNYFVQDINPFWYIKQ